MGVEMTEKHESSGSSIPMPTEDGQTWLEAARGQLRQACVSDNRIDWIRHMEEWAKYVQASMEALHEVLTEVELVQLRDITSDKTEVLAKR